jgi:hypothetical protein
VSYLGLAISSMAEALRWRAVGRCASQQAMLQNISFTRPELQVETEQRKYMVSIAIGFLHMEQTPNGGMPASVRTAHQKVKAKSKEEFEIPQRR